MRFVVAAMAAATLLVIPVSEASAYKLAGKPWKGETVTYHYSGKGFKWPISTAVRAWNRSGIDIRLKKASKEKAQLHIRIKKYPGNPYLGSVPAYATIGSIPRDTQVPSPFGGPPGRGATLWFNKKLLEKYARAWVFTHELGHVLGLDHVGKRCAVMTQDLWPVSSDGPYLFTPTGCARPPRWQWRCRLAERDDVEGLIKYYGGEVKPRREFCPQVSQGLAPPAQVKITQTAEEVRDGEYSFAVTGTDKYGSLAQVFRSTCPAGGPLPGAPEELFYLNFEERPAGRYCLAVWALGKDGFPSKRPFAAVFQHAPPNPGPPKAVQAVVEFGTQVSLDWTPDPKARYVSIRRALGSCPSSLGQGENPVWYGDTDYEEPNFVDDLSEEPPGDYCYSLFSKTVYGNVSAPAKVEVTVE